MPTAKPAEHLATLAGAVCALALAGLLLAQGAEASVIHACVKRTSGATRIVSAKAKCRKGEQKLSWNTSGPAGPAGRSGATGAEGKAGANGTDGAVAGFTESTSTTVVSLPPLKEEALLSKVVPPGSYLVFAKAVLLAEAKSALVGSVLCALDDTPGTSFTGGGSGNELDISGWSSPLAEQEGASSFNAIGTVSLQGAVSSTLTTTLTLACATVSQDKGVESKAGDAQLGAIQTSHNS